MLLLIALAATAITGTDAAKGCRFLAAQPRELIIYEDTAINDDGDFLVSLKLLPQQESAVVQPLQGDRIRYKSRYNPKAKWWHGGRIPCKGGIVVNVP